MTKTRLIIQITSDNYEKQPMTFRAYAVLRLQMSTGDFYTHTYCVREVELNTPILHVSDLTNEAPDEY